MRTSPVTLWDVALTEIPHALCLSGTAAGYLWGGVKRPDGNAERPSEPVKSRPDSSGAIWERGAWVMCFSDGGKVRGSRGFPGSSKGTLTSSFFPPCHRNTIPIKTVFHVDLRGSRVFWKADVAPSLDRHPRNRKFGTAKAQKAF